MEGLGASIATARTHASTRRVVIAVDGPAASGKGTLARRLADHFGVGYLDTGLLYRAVAMRVLYKKKDPADAKAAGAAASSLKEHDLSNPKLRGERVGQAASIVSAIPEVRAALLDYQRNFAARDGGAVLDGRDIGTVVCPQADVKLFITASIATRAHRRQRQLEGYGFDITAEEVEADLRERDTRDAARAVAPAQGRARRHHRRHHRHERQRGVREGAGAGEGEAPAALTRPMRLTRLLP
ncbi:MAG: (d)CMP kinase [Alphaproteobacteria bacterium]